MHWPLDQNTACEIVRLRFIRGQESLVKKFKELHVRSQIVKQMANIYIQRHIGDLGERPHVLKLCVSDAGSVKQRMAMHIEKRVDSEYPPSEFGCPQGKAPQAFIDMVKAQEVESTKYTPSSEHLI